MKNVKEYVKLMRPHHYIKNILIFLPIIFSKNLRNTALLKNAIIGTIAFCLMASCVYIINDIKDVELDRKHEKKKNRPIASGRVSIKGAVVLGVILIALSIALNICIGLNPVMYIIFYSYLIINIMYSIKLKHIPILDVVILAAGFLLRVVYGAIIIGVELSNWMYLTILVFSFYMGLGKRRNEYKKMGSNGRNVLKYYNESYLNNNMYMFMVLGIVFYSLWCIDVNNQLKKAFNAIWTVPLVIVICMKYSLDIEGESYGDPIDVLLGDKVLICLSILYAAVMFGILYAI